MGCKVNLNTDSSNCGSCGIVVPTQAACKAGNFACMTRRGNCDNNWNNGCEVGLGSDVNNCGQCGNSCPFGGSCSNGVCSASLVISTPTQVSAEVNRCVYYGFICDLIQAGTSKNMVDVEDLNFVLANWNWKKANKD